jgi:hypothetical protein
MVGYGDSKDRLSGIAMGSCLWLSRALYTCGSQDREVQ